MPLVSIILRVLIHSMHAHWDAELVYPFILAFCCLLLFKILLAIVSVGKAHQWFAEKNQQKDEVEDEEFQVL